MRQVEEHRASRPANVGIEKYFSHIVIKSQFIKAHDPTEHLRASAP